VTIANDRLKQFFSKQKIGAFDALAKSNKHIGFKKKSLHKNLTDQSDKPLSASLLINAPLKIKKEQKPIVQKEVSEPLANYNQSVSEPLAISEHSVSNPLTVSKQPVSHSLSKPLANSIKKIEEIQFSDLRDFSNKERDLLTLIFWQCHQNCSLLSPPISTEEIRHTLKISAERVRNLIFRITKKGGVRVTQHKSGQSAYRVFELPKSLYQWMINQQANRGIRFIEPLASPLADALRSNSSSLINKKTTTSLPEDWKKINYDSLVEFGFSETQLKQLYETNLTNPEIIQESINHFAYGLENNEKTKAYKIKDPLNIFMGVLRKGQSWHEANYISPKELALKKIVEEKKKEKERYDLMIKELMDIEFPVWRNKISPNQIKLIVPEETLRINLAPAITACLRTHYLEKILLPRLETEEINE
jgi:DNA-binding transcriptional regulator GbsR (MarR family)